MDAKYNSSLRGLIILKFSREYFWEHEDELEHAIEVATYKQCQKMKALLLNNLKAEFEQFVKELQSYQIRRTV